MSASDEIVQILQDTLQLGERAQKLEADTRLFGNIPEFDSIAVVSVITAIEDQFGIEFDDDEITADVFETVGSLTQLVNGKIGS